MLGFERFATHSEAHTALRPGRPFMSRGCGLATDQKAVRRRGPGRVVLGSKPQLATPEKLVSWATRAPTTKENLVSYTSATQHERLSHLDHRVPDERGRLAAVGGEPGEIRADRRRWAARGGRGGAVLVRGAPAGGGPRPRPA